jgi:hypothetical protein
MSEIEEICNSILKAAQTFKERNQAYGSNYLNVGRAMQALFPNGVHLKTENDFKRFHLLELSVVKLSRYCNNFSSGGHLDSIHDQGVYCFMIEGIDKDIMKKETKGE